MDSSEIVFQNDHSDRSRPLVPAFAVQICDKTEKLGENTCFFLTVRKTDHGGGDGDEKEIKRLMEDFRVLDRKLRAETAENRPGVITPRLSTKETSLVQTVPDNNARFMGKYAAERVMFQRYVDAVLNHPVIGYSKTVEDFLSLPDFGSYAGFKLTLAKRLNGAVEELRTSSYVDPDPFYQSRKIWLMNYSGAVSDFSNAFTLQNMCKKNLSAVLSSLSATMNSNGHPKDYAIKLLGLSSEAIKQEEVCPTLDKLRERGPLTAFLQYGWHLAYWNGELTLGTFLKHHIAQLDSFKDMLQQRTLILKEMDSAKKTAEKAKPPKQEPASALYKDAEQLVQRCTSVGKEEVERMDSTETKGFRQALIDYAESQMQAAQESYEILVEQIKKLQEWQPE